MCLAMLISILAFIILITILVFVHEMGHYIAARSVGIRVEKFYVGFNFFGLGIKKIVNGIEYGIGLFPIGTIGLGIVSVYSDNRVPNPPHKIIALILFFYLTNYCRFRKRYNKFTSIFYIFFFLFNNFFHNIP